MDILQYVEVQWAGNVNMKQVGSGGVQVGSCGVYETFNLLAVLF